MPKENKSFINVSFVTKEDRKVFKNLMLDCIEDALLSIPTIKKICDNDPVITKTMIEVREDLIASFNVVKNIITIHEISDDPIPKEHLGKVRTAFNDFMDAHNCIADFYRAALNEFAKKKTIERSAGRP
jgi:hypothetical protein